MYSQLETHLCHRLYINSVNHVVWFSNVKPTLFIFSWDKPYLVMIYYLFYYIAEFCWLKILRISGLCLWWILVHSFLLSVFVWFCIRVMLSSSKLGRREFPSSVFGKSLWTVTIGFFLKCLEDFDHVISGPGVFFDANF